MGVGLLPGILFRLSLLIAFMVMCMWMCFFCSFYCSLGDVLEDVTLVSLWCCYNVYEASTFGIQSVSLSVHSLGWSVFCFYRVIWFLVWWLYEHCLWEWSVQVAWPCWRAFLGLRWLGPRIDFYVSGWNEEKGEDCRRKVTPQRNKTSSNELKSSSS